MTKPRLTYFDFDGGRGEECRLAFVVAGVEFDDHRVKHGEWEAMKAETPFGALPVLEVDGRGKVAQSNAILVYIGRKHGLHPATPWEAMVHEAVMESVEDLRHRVARTASDDEEEKRARREEFAQGWLRQWATSISDQITGPFLEGDQINVADIKLFNIIRWFRRGGLDHIAPTYFDAFPKIDTLYQAVEDHEAIRGRYA